MDNSIRGSSPSDARSPVSGQPGLVPSAFQSMLQGGSADGLLTTNVQDLYANAAEELTFQFSETVEAQTHSLEERLEASTEVAETHDLKVEQVQAIMKLMEGKEGYRLLRQQAQNFAQKLRDQPQDAWAELELKNMSPERRHGLLELAQEILLEEPVQQEQTAEAVKQVREALSDTRSSLQEISKAQKFSTLEKTTQDDALKSAYTSLVLVEPTVRNVFESAIEMAQSGGDVSATLNRMHHGWNKLFTSDQLNQLGGLLIVDKLIKVVRSMMHHTGQYLQQVGCDEDRQAALLLNPHVRTVLNMAQTAAPSSMIDKWLTALLARPRHCPRCVAASSLLCVRCGVIRRKCLCPDRSPKPCTCSDVKGFFLALLHRHAQRWPEAIWMNEECKKAMLEQLIKKQQQQPSQKNALHPALQRKVL